MNSAIFLVAVVVLLQILSPTAAYAQQNPGEPKSQKERKSQVERIRAHDPVMIRQDSTYYLFCTGRGITVWSSKDMETWRREAPVFDTAPVWAKDVVPGFRNHIWAPDISFHNGKYYLYYSVSAFGKNTSAIGLAINTTLDPGDPRFKWVDQGIVVRSVPGRDMWNAIDPHLAYDEKGVPWLAFGSFWSGIKLVRLNKSLDAPAKPEEWYTIAARERDFGISDTLAGNAAIEAPFIFRRNNYYYLFVSFDYCCRGIESTYKIMVGRAREITGPYIDKEGKKMIRGGGTLMLEGNSDWHGVGHNAVYTFEGKDYLIFHGYEASGEGEARLLILPLGWDENGWPKVNLE